MHAFDRPRAATFIRRYKRFFADVHLDGAEVVAHLPNTGSLKTCLFEGSACVVTETTDPKRKLKATLHLLETPTGWVGVNTGIPNQLVTKTWREHPEWAHYAVAKPEFKINAATRLDLVLAPSATDLELRQNLHYVEVKNVTYAEDGVAKFPDAVTARGQKHLRELMALRELGSRAELLFVVQRTDASAFAPADHIDPRYGELLRHAVARGVRVRALACAIDPAAGIRLVMDELPILLG